MGKSQQSLVYNYAQNRILASLQKHTHDINIKRNCLI